MRNLVRLAGVTLAGLAAVAVLGIGHALAAQQTTLSKFSGTITAPGPSYNISGTITAPAAGTWTRTITDVVGPNEPNAGKVLATYFINVPWTNGMTAAQFAAAYRAAALATLPAPETGANGYGAVPQILVQPTIRVAKQAGTYNYSDTPFPAGLTATTNPPLTAEDAPIASPVGLASLAASLSALAYWNRRRRQAA